jgi:hypothetical protein
MKRTNTKGHKDILKWQIKIKKKTQKAMSSAGLESNDWRREVYLTQKEKQRTTIKNLIERIIIIYLAGKKQSFFC